MQFNNLFRDAKTLITIFGINPLSPHIASGAEFFCDLLKLNEDLKIKILCESDTECFSQSLCTDTDFSKNRASFTSLLVHRDRVIGRTEKEGLKASMLRILEKDPNSDSEYVRGILDRISVLQSNLRMPINLIQTDDTLMACVTTTFIPQISSYEVITKGSSQYTDFMAMLDYFTADKEGSVFLSKPRQELIQMYDSNGYPRGIYPRACFYSTAYARYSIWGFIFNRKGELLMHQRSMITQDGRGLWDKSVGGHVDLLDSSTYITAQRELVEEMFLPEAEYSKYVRADLGDIIHFGEWNPRKRPEQAVRDEIQGLEKDDWVMFRATDNNGDPLTITRVSERRIHNAKGELKIKKTVFKSDVYFFIAPTGYIDDDKQMDNLLKVAEEKGAAQAHKLVSINGLRDWISSEEAKGTANEIFTDDMLYVNLQCRDLVENFSEFVKYLEGNRGYHG